MTKDAPVVVTLRIDRATRDLLKEIARRERRSMNKTVEWLIEQHCKQHDVVAPVTKRPTKKGS